MKFARGLALLAAAVALLTGCGGGSAPTPPAPIQSPSSTIWTLAPGSYTEYTTSTGSGTYDAATGVITIDRASLVPGGTSRMTCLPYGNAIARVYGPAGVTVTTVPAGLVGALVEGSDGHLIGEVANAYATSIIPPEPLITASPQLGEMVNLTSAVVYAGGSAGSINTSYWTVATDVTIDGFTHATVTALAEWPGVAGKTVAYEQVFDGGTDLAEIWYGPVAADGSVQVTLVRRIGAGRNP